MKSPIASRESAIAAVHRQRLKRLNISPARNAAVITCTVMAKTPKTANSMRKSASIRCEEKGCESCADIITGKSAVSIIPPVTSTAVMTTAAESMPLHRKYSDAALIFRPFTQGRSAMKVMRLPPPRKLKRSPSMKVPYCAAAGIFPKFDGLMPLMRSVSRKMTPVKAAISDERAAAFVPSYAI